MIRRRHSSSTAADHRLAVQVAGLGEQLQGEVPADHRGQFGRRPGRRGGLPDPPGQHGTDLRHRPVRGPGRGRGGLGRARTVEEAGPYRFDDEQGIPPGGGVQQAGLRGGQPQAQDLAGQLPGPRGIQRHDADVGHLARGAEHPEHLGEFRVGRHLVAPGRGHYQQRLALAQVQQQLQPGQRVLVAPLHIVQDQQRGTAGGQHGAGQPLEEPVPLPGVRHRPRRRGRPGIPRRDQAVNLAGPDRLQVGPRRLQRRAAQPLGYRGQGQPAPGGEAACPERREAIPLHRGRELVEQPGLPDARLAGQHREARCPGQRFPPALLEQLKLSLPADQPLRAAGRPLDLARARRARAGDHRPGRPGRARAGARAHPGPGQPLIFRDGGLVRAHAQLAFQHRYAAVIGLQGRCPVSGQRLHLEQAAVADLFQRFEFDPLPGPLDRVLVGAGHPVQRDQLVEQDQAHPVQPVPFGGYPVVVPRGQQLTTVSPHRLGRGPAEPGIIASRPCGGGGAGRGLEVRDVQLAAGAGPPQQRAPVGGQPAGHRGQPGAQRVQFPAQVGAGLGGAGARPELGGDVLAALRHIPVQQQETEQGHSPRRPQVHDRAVQHDTLLPQQRNLEHGVTPTPACSRRSAARDAARP